jgi:hypothetical protein
VICNSAEGSWYACRKTLSQSLASFVHLHGCHMQRYEGTLQVPRACRVRTTRKRAGASVDPGECQAMSQNLITCNAEYSTTFQPRVPLTFNTVADHELYQNYCDCTARDAVGRHARPITSIFFERIKARWRGDTGQPLHVALVSGSMQEDQAGAYLFIQPSTNDRSVNVYYSDLLFPLQRI